VTEPADPRRLLVLYDAGCGFCIWTIAVLRRLDRRDRLTPGSIQAHRHRLGDLDDERALESFHAVGADGSVRSAGAALAAVLSVLPLLRPAGAVLRRLPRTADRLYFLVARRRAGLARFLPERVKRRARVTVGAEPVDAPSCGTTGGGGGASCAVPAAVAPVTGPITQAVVADATAPPAAPTAEEHHALDVAAETAPASTPARVEQVRPGPAAPAAGPAGRPAADEATAPAADEAGVEEAGVSSSVEVVGRHLKPMRFVVAAALLLLVIAALVGLAQPLATQWVLETLGRAGSLRNPVLILVGTVLGAALAQGGGQFLMLRVAEDVVLGTRRQMIRQILGLSVGAMHKREPGELMARVISDSASVRQIALQSVTQSVSGTVVVLGSIGMMIYLDLYLFLVTFVVVAGLCTSMILIMPRIRRAAKETQRSIGAVGNELERALGTFTTVKAADAVDREREVIGRKAERARNSGVRSAMWTALAGMTSALTVQAAFLVVLGVGGWRVQEGELSVPTLVAFLLYAMQLSQPVLQLTSAVTSFQSGRAALERIAETEKFEQETEMRAPGIAPEAVPGAKGKRGPRSWRTAVRFEDVTFRYPGKTEPVLRNLTLTIPGQGLTALVGPSGSGKSTVLRLIEGFYPVQEGRIWVANRVLGDWNLHKLRDAVAYVEQESPVLAGTVEENLTYGLDEGEVDEPDLHEALDRVGLQGRISALDQAVHHRGGDLSGGERQRISMARALLRQPKLMLLDEVTSQLDATNETLLRDLIMDISRQLPVVMVAHRLSTVLQADRVVLMEAGAVRAIGTHQELLAADELYRDMIEQQTLAAAV
jgi:ABC-type multidrug transport system fused ATPase/permease subunit/predicted DCC family thiol-disulfide oxidoreductase YuxK